MSDEVKVFSYLGVPWGEVERRLDEELSPSAYKRVDGTRANLTDINHAYAYPVMSALFGPYGYGWGLDWDEMVISERQTARGGTMHVVFVRRATFWYRIIVQRGDVRSEERVAIPVSGGAENTVLWYAAKGAITNALGTGLMTIGWQASVYRGERSHETVGRRPAVSQRQPRAQTGQRNKPQTGGGKSGVAARGSKQQAGGAKSKRPWGPHALQDNLRKKRDYLFAKRRTYVEVERDGVVHREAVYKPEREANVGIVAGMLNKILGGDEKRHTFFKWLTGGIESLKDPAAWPWVDALAAYLLIRKVNGKLEYGCRDVDGGPPVIDEQKRRIIEQELSTALEFAEIGEIPYEQEA